MLQEILAQIEMGVVVVTRDFHVKIWNVWMAKLSGVDADGAVGRNILDLMPALRACELERRVSDRKAEQQVFSCSFGGRSKLAGLGEVEVSIGPLTSAAFGMVEFAEAKEPLYMIQFRQAILGQAQEKTQRGAKAPPCTFAEMAGSKLNAWIMDFLQWTLDLDESQLSDVERQKVIVMITTCRRLVDVVANIMADTAKATESDNAEPNKLTVLVADDDALTRQIVSKIMSQRGHDVATAVNGLDAVGAVQLSDKFDVILMDINMPLLDGVSATNQIRSLLGKRGKIPIIAITGHAAAGDQERFLNAGFDDYQSKPIDTEKLINKIERVTGNRGNQLRSAEAFLKATTRAIESAGAHLC